MQLWLKALGAMAVGILLPGSNLAAACADSGPAVTIRSTSTTEYFALSGRTREALWHELNGAGNPLNALYRNQGTALGHAGVEYRYRYQPAFGSSPSSCRIASADIELRFTTVLPELADGTVSDLLARQWPRFQETIAEHEAGHHAIYRDLLSQIPAALQQLEEASCAELDQRISLTINAVVDAVRQRSRDYDQGYDSGRYVAAAF